MASFGASPSLGHDLARDERSQILSSHLNYNATLVSTSDACKRFGSPEKVNRDGKPSRRRGPKPDSKPALTRRQQLNRQAQRSHRERKAEYIKNLETEISSLRGYCFKDFSSENSTSLQKHRDTLDPLKEENNALKRILLAYGIPFEVELKRLATDRCAFDSLLSTPSTSSPGYSGSTIAGTETTSGSNNLNSRNTPATIVTPDPSPPVTNIDHLGSISPGKEQQSSQYSNLDPLINCMDHDISNTAERRFTAAPVAFIPGIFEEDPQLQVDFILTKKSLESPCREHTNHYCHQSNTEPSMPYSGRSHAQMASCLSPPGYISSTNQNQNNPQKTYDPPAANMTTLLNLSRQLVAGSQFTPAMALQYLRMHEAYHMLTREDVKAIVETLNTKIRCYGFGAVVEDFELMDCLNSVLGTHADYGCAADGNGNGGGGGGGDIGLPYGHEGDWTM